MKINGLELYQISIPFAELYRLSKIYGTLHDAQAVIVKLKTDEGLVGLGEADPMNPFAEESPESTMAVLGDIIAPNLLGQNISDGIMTVPAGAGLGINLNEDKLKKYTVAHATVKGKFLRPENNSTWCG